jgi:ATP-dependent Clp protease adaptor protein ClpS
MADDTRTPEGEGEGSLALKTRVKRPRRWLVIIHNDDYTTMEFVIALLTGIFKKTHAEAVELMLVVHRRGAAPIGAFSKDVAATKVAEAEQQAKAHRFPLVLTMEAE